MYLRTRCSSVILLAAVLFPPPTSSFSGVVTDKSGTPIPGVTIALFHTNTNTQESTTTDNDGRYTFPNVKAYFPYGTHEIGAVKPGFAFLASIGHPQGAVIKSDHNALFETVIALPSSVPLQVFDANFIALPGGEKLVDLPATGQKITYGVGDDGMLVRGVSWPDSRFVDNADGTVTDRLTGLIWLQDAGCLGRPDWPSALAAVSQLAAGSCGLNDGSAAGQWRLPNIGELESLIDTSMSRPAVSSGNPFLNIDDTYWSSTTYRGVTTNAWVIRFTDGRYINDSIGNSKTARNGAWALRSSATPGAVSLPATGQFIVYAPGDDASLLAGVRLTYPRFIDNNDGTISDSVTGLVWLKKADCIQADWWNSMLTIRNLGHGKCGLADGSMAGQWRMPNRAELLSLVDRAETNQALRFNTVFYSPDGSVEQPAVFEAFMSSEFLWTSTTDTIAPSFAWAVYSCDYGVYDIAKASLGYSLAVR